MVRCSGWLEKVIDHDRCFLGLVVHVHAKLDHLIMLGEIDDVPFVLRFVVVWSLAQEIDGIVLFLACLGVGNLLDLLDGESRPEDWASSSAASDHYAGDDER
jgi:hypothetical protein